MDLETSINFFRSYVIITDHKFELLPRSGPFCLVEAFNTSTSVFITAEETIYCLRGGSPELVEFVVYVATLSVAQAI